MQVIETKSDKEILASLIAEIAKAQNEIACAKRDIDKAQSRLRFLIVLANTLIDRQGD
jgi:hypothetical protein